MRVEPVDRRALIDASAELLAASPCQPPELSLVGVGEAGARYVAELRHGDDGGGARLVARAAGELVGVAEVRPSPFDREALGVATARIVGLEATTAQAAGALVGAALEACRTAGARLVLSRAAPGSPALGALAARGQAAYGATVLYGGDPRGADARPAGVAVAERSEDLEAAAEIAREAWSDSHFSRDPRIDGERAAAVYERWVRSEASRGATVLLARDDGGCPAAMAVCRDNPLARRLLHVELWHLHLLATRPDAAGRGLGLRVAGAVVAEAARAGAEAIQTGVDTAALGAARIYARLGLLPRSAGMTLHGWI